MDKIGNIRPKIIETYKKIKLIQTNAIIIYGT